jgi:hypothetical protein
LAEYSRQAVIIEVNQNSYTVILVSSNFDLYNPTFDFVINDQHPDFLETGLDKKSYCVGQSILQKTPEQIAFYRGRLSGVLLDEFRNHFGV